MIIGFKKEDFRYQEWVNEVMGENDDSNALDNLYDLSVDFYSEDETITDKASCIQQYGDIIGIELRGEITSIDDLLLDISTAKRIFSNWCEGTPEAFDL